MSYQDNRIFTLNEPNAPRLNPALAVEIGLNESIMLLQLEFWIAISDNERDGQKWTYQSVRDIKEKWFPFWSPMTINRTIKSLESSGYIITTTKYNTLKYDKTRWIALNFDELSKLESISIKGYGTRSYQNGTGSNQNGTTIPENTTENSKTTTTKPVPPKPADPPPVSDPQSSSSSSFDDNKKVNQHDLSNLMQSVPQDERSPQVEQRLTKALMTGLYTLAYLLDAIAWTTDHAPKNYLSYLGNCIDKGWAPEGYHLESAKKADREAQKIRDRQREQEKQKQQQKALKSHHERINQLLDSVDIDLLDNFIDGQALNPVERSRFKKGKRAMLRRVWIERYLSHNI